MANAGRKALSFLEWVSTEESAKIEWIYAQPDLLTYLHNHLAQQSIDTMAATQVQYPMDPNMNVFMFASIEDHQMNQRKKELSGLFMSYPHLLVVTKNRWRTSKFNKKKKTFKQVSISLQSYAQLQKLVSSHQSKSVTDALEVIIAEAFSQMKIQRREDKLHQITVQTLKKEVQLMSQEMTVLKESHNQLVNALRKIALNLLQEKKLVNPESAQLDSDKSTADAVRELNRLIQQQQQLQMLESLQKQPAKGLI